MSAQNLNEKHNWGENCWLTLFWNGVLNNVKWQRAPWLMIHMRIVINGAGVCVRMCCVYVCLCKPQTGFCKHSYLLTWGKNSCCCDFAFRQVCVKGMSNANNSSWLTSFLSIYRLSFASCIFQPSFSVALSSFLPSLFVCLTSPLPPRCCPALPAVQRGRSELWDPAPGSLRCHLCMWGHHPVSPSLTASCLQTSSSPTPCPAPPLVGPHRLHHQCQKLASPWAPQEWRQAFLPTSIHLSHTVSHAVARAAGGQEQYGAGGAHRGPEETAGGKALSYCTYESLEISSHSFPWILLRQESCASNYSWCDV